MQTNQKKSKPTISVEGLEMLELICKPSLETPETTVAELQWNACKRHIMRCVALQLQVQ